MEIYFVGYSSGERERKEEGWYLAHFQSIGWEDVVRVLKLGKTVKMKYYNDAGD